MCKYILNVLLYVLCILFLYCQVLGIVAGVLLQDHEVRGKEFQQLPYHRIFIMLFIELNAPEHILETINFQVIYSNRDTMTTNCQYVFQVRSSRGGEAGML